MTSFLNLMMSHKNNSFFNKVMECDIECHKSFDLPSLKYQLIFK